MTYKKNKVGHKLTIGICGVDFQSVNYGVAALGYSQISLLNECVQKLSLDATYYIFSLDDEKTVKDVCKKLNISGKISVFDKCRYRTGIKGLTLLRNRMSDCDIIFDLTGGDSFSDIYGMRCYILQATEKITAIKKSRLVISPQTIGPYKGTISKILAKYILNRASGVFTRDDKSEKYLSEICPKVKGKVTSDLAFYLPYSAGEPFNKDGKMHVGLNVSALLWQGGYTGNNEFGLKCDYKELNRRIIKYCNENGKYVVHLIGHVFMENGDNDYIICEELNSDFKNTVLAPWFSDPVAAKSYFSRLDAVIGARMHVTIGAISSGTVCIPISYSRKFEGLYESINYPYVVEATKWDTEKCFNEIVHHLEHVDEIQPVANRAVSLANDRNNVFRDYILDTLESIVNEK